MKKYLLVYSTRFPVSEPPAYYLSLVGEISKQVKVMMLDVHGFEQSHFSSFSKYMIELIGFSLRKNGYMIFWVQQRMFRYLFRLMIYFHKMLGFEIVLVKNFPERHFSDRLISHGVSFFDCTDHFYPGEFSRNKQELKAFTGIFVNFFHMKLLLEKYSSNVIVTATGYLRHLPSPQTLKVKARAKKNKTVVFFGGISRRLDFNLLQETAFLLPDYTFYFLGEIYLNKYYVDSPGCDDDLVDQWQKLCKTVNVRYLGFKNVTQAVSFLPYFKVGIIPYKTTDYMNQFSNPMKQYEYLWSGLSVVSTELFSTVENQNKYPVFVAEKKYGAFAELIKKVGEKKISSLDRKQLIKENYLPCKVEHMLQVIENCLIS